MNVLASMLFAGLSGSAIADASGLGPLEIQMMTDGGYDRDGSHAGSGAVTVRICPLNSYLKLQQLVLS